MNSAARLGLTLASAALAVSTLAGCASQQAITPAEAKVAYRAIAKASCDKAQAVGEVETNGTYMAIMVTRSHAYKGFSAAYFEKPAKYEVLYEANAFNACSDWFTFSEYESVKKSVPIKVTYDNATGAFDTVQDLGQFGIFKTRMTVKDGLLATSTNIADKTKKTVSIQYGNLTNDQLAILKQAVDNLPASQKG